MKHNKRRKRKIPIHTFALAVDRSWMDIPDEHLRLCQAQNFLNVIARNDGKEVALVGRMTSSKLEDFVIAAHLDKDLTDEDAEHIKEQRDSMPSGSWDEYDKFRPNSVIVPICYCFQNSPFDEYTKELSICPMRFITEFTDGVIQNMTMQVAKRGKQTESGTPIQAIGMHGDMQWLKPDNRAPHGEHSGYVEMNEVHYNPDAEPLTFQVGSNK